MQSKYYVIFIVATGETIADKVTIARDFISRSVGLLNRGKLSKGEGLVIDPCSSIHTFFMKFPIDVLYLDKNNHVIKIVNNLKPWRLSQCWFAKRVVELEAGSIIKTNIKCGNILKIDINY